MLCPTELRARFIDFNRRLKRRQDRQQDRQQDKQDRQIEGLVRTDRSAGVGGSNVSGARSFPLLGIANVTWKFSIGAALFKPPQNCVS